MGVARDELIGLNKPGSTALRPLSLLTMATRKERVNAHPDYKELQRLTGMARRTMQLLSEDREAAYRLESRDIARDVLIGIASHVLLTDVAKRMIYESTAEDKMNEGDYIKFCNDTMKDVEVTEKALRLAMDVCFNALGMTSIDLQRRIMEQNFNRVHALMKRIKAVI